LFVAALVTACSGGSKTPTSPSNTQLGSTGGGGSTQSNNNQVEVKGRVDALPPSTPAGTFTSAGKTVVTNSSTVFASSTTTKSFADLKLGVEVEVRGIASGNTVTAARVEIENEAEPEPEPEPEPHDPPSPNPPAPTPPVANPPTPNPPREAELSGTIAGLTGTASSFQFTVGATLVKGDATTMIAGDSTVPRTFANLKNGAIAEVHGTQQTGFVQALRIQIEGAENDPPDVNENEVDVRGALGPITGTCPAISSTVGTTKFATTASTRFDDVACPALKAGASMRVRGIRNADGSVTATRLQKD
jgi:hypothetical protein